MEASEKPTESEMSESPEITPPESVDVPLGAFFNRDAWELSIVETFCHLVQPIEKNDNANLFVRLNFAPKEVWNVLSEKPPGRYAIVISLEPIEPEGISQLRVLWLGDVHKDLSHMSMSGENAELIAEGSQAAGDALAAVLPVISGIPWLVLPGALVKAGGAIGQRLLGSSRMNVGQAFILDERTFGWKFGVGPLRAPMGLLDLEARMALDPAISVLELSVCLWLNRDKAPYFELKHSVEVSPTVGG